MELSRIQKQMQFIVEIDKAKDIFRQTYLANGKRRENDAEHSWHLAIMAFTFAEYFGENLDIAKVMKMVLLHDIVEIDAGDTYCYDAKANEDKAVRELAAADRIYGILPKDQAEEFRKLWQEFEEGETPEANFANVLDRLHPAVLNFIADGKAWIDHNVHLEQVLERNSRLLKGPKEMRDFFLNLMDLSVEKGYLKK